MYRDGVLILEERKHRDGNATQMQGRGRAGGGRKRGERYMLKFNRCICLALQMMENEVYKLYPPDLPRYPAMSI